MASLYCSFTRSLFLQRFLRSSWSLAMLARSSSSVVAPNDTNVLPFSAIPGLKGSIRNILEYTKGSFFDVVTKRFERYGPIYSEEILGTRIVNVSDVEATSKVLRTDRTFQMRPGLQAVEDAGDEINPDTGFGPISNDYEKWYHDRSLLAPKLKRLKDALETLPILNTVADDFVRRMQQQSRRDGTINNIEEQFTYWIIEAIAAGLFNERLGFYDQPPDPDAVVFVKSAKEMLKNVGTLNVTAPLYKYIKIPAYYALKRSFLTNSATGMDIINRELAKKKGERGNRTTQTFFEYLSAKEKITSKSMATYLTGLMAGGVDTTSTTCLWLLYHLAQNPEVQEKLYQELVSVLGPDGEVSKTNIQRLSLVKATLKETGRMNPTAAFTIARVFDKDLNVLGYNIPAGVYVLLHEHLLSVDERYYGEDAKQFVPERWLRDATGKRTQENPFTSLPFGYGVRMCLGRRLAELPIYTLVSKIILSFRLEYAGDTAVNKDMVGGLMKPDRPLLVKFIPRK
ncbi:cytochrome P450 27C1-like [Paramuricea clavata]|uniref:Cytochrome P450 27C1-like n=1 Tax=Paramuricea clavata TaxID=317549 RepID=A0A6S7J417_PARCT|nr:cytochrome P450 27C1-like [Paramuricea clavata]